MDYGLYTFSPPPPPPPPAPPRPLPRYAGVPCRGGLVHDDEANVHMSPRSKRRTGPWGAASSPAIVDDDHSDGEDGWLSVAHGGNLITLLATIAF